MNHPDSVFFRTVHIGDFHLFAVHIYLAAVPAVSASQDFDQRGFTRAVFAEQRMNLPRAQLQPDVLQNFYIRKGFRDSIHFKQLFHILLLHMFPFPMVLPQKACLQKVGGKSHAAHLKRRCRPHPG